MFFYFILYFAHFEYFCTLISYSPLLIVLSVHRKRAVNGKTFFLNCVFADLFLFEFFFSYFFHTESHIDIPLMIRTCVPNFMAFFRTRSSICIESEFNEIHIKQKCIMILNETLIGLRSDDDKKTWTIKQFKLENHNNMDKSKTICYTAQI